MEDRLKELMQELGNAINESLSDSDRIAGAIGEIKRAGYDVFLVLEATIGFNKRDETDEDAEAEVELEAEVESEPEPRPPERPSRKRRFESGGKIKWTSQDHKFLRALKISPEDDSN